MFGEQTFAQLRTGFRPVCLYLRVCVCVRVFNDLELLRYVLRCAIELAGDSMIENVG